jgi:FAD/FMN-containing dehydrogenase
VSLDEILNVACTPDADGQAWLLPVAPGTRYVTVGGAIANDVHGKNHHTLGTFGEHLVSFELARSDGTTIFCSGSENQEFFRATIGGLGLTGLVLSATFQLRRVPGLCVEFEQIRFENLDEFFGLARESETTWEYTAAWIDCLAKGRGLGRGLFSRARHLANAAPKSLREPRQLLPVDAPISFANAVTLPPFNALYWRKLGWRKRGSGVSDYCRELFPLDVFDNWNRLYGRKGFYQFQSVTPLEAPEALVELLTCTAQEGQGSMLTVLKSFRARPSAGLLSFPKEGFTLALDFPNRGPDTLSLLARLEGIVVASGGRIYPAKDGAMSRKAFEQGYQDLDSFREFVDPRFGSDFARRVGIVGEHATG